MNITITFRHMAGTDAVKSYAYEKVAKLQKFLRQAMSAQVTLSVDGAQHHAEANISSGSSHFHASQRGEDMYASIDMMHDKLERQIRAAKGTAAGNKKGAETVRELAPEGEGAADEGSSQES